MIVRLKGGLGNQMFQYAFVRCLQEKYGIQEVYLDDSFFSKAERVKVTQYGNSIDDFSVEYKKVDKKKLSSVCFFSHNQKPMTLAYRIPMALEIVLNKKYYHVKNFKYVDPTNLLKYEYLDGSWQSWMYLKGIEGFLHKEFTIKKTLPSELINQIEMVKDEESVFIGIRRGDYIINKANRALYGSMSDQYYNSAIDIILERYPNAVFYIMSDDIEWVKHNIRFKIPVVYREGNMIGSAAEEMAFMSSCKHAIIPNSTFHWWGAWLINNPDKIVIVPSEWFADGTEIDILPPEWVKIPR